MSDFAVPNEKPGECCKCHGSGKWYGRGAVVNGVFNGYIGTCHSCGGTGEQTKSDIARNNAYNRFKLSSLSA